MTDTVPSRMIFLMVYHALDPNESGLEMKHLIREKDLDHDHLERGYNARYCDAAGTHHHAALCGLHPVFQSGNTHRIAIEVIDMYDGGLCKECTRIARTQDLIDG